MAGRADAFLRAMPPAFAFLAGWLALRRSALAASRIWLGVTVGIGLLFGWMQVMRGAHYLSHSLWTGWICAATALLAYHASACWRTVASASPEVGAAGDSLAHGLSSYGNR